MKKFVTLLLAFVMTVPMWSLAACSNDNRAEQLKMYVPGEYIDSEIFDAFEDWYKEQTGKTVKVVTPSTFDAVEEIMTAVEKDHADYDLLLPSDYAVEQLIKKDLLVAEEVSHNDDVVDALFEEIVNDLVDIIKKDEGTSEVLDMLMVAKYFERIGDHAVNIAEWVQFSITGEHKRL